MESLPVWTEESVPGSALPCLTPSWLHWAQSCPVPPHPFPTPLGSALPYLTPPMAVVSEAVPSQQINTQCLCIGCLLLRHLLACRLCWGLQAAGVWVCPPSLIFLALISKLWVFFSWQQQRHTKARPHTQANLEPPWPVAPQPPAGHVKFTGSVQSPREGRAPSPSVGALQRPW